ncbi:MAG: hypothetical protein ABIJ40_02420 [Bacteroidota bacterium]
MKFTSMIVFIMVLISLSNNNAQIKISHMENGTAYFCQFTSAPFPHPLRREGHTYDDKFFSAEDHYRDSSVLVFIPQNFDRAKEVNYVLYFHGWRNNIDTALVQFNLIQQFAESGVNAVFVLPEGPKNAPDSFGGKMEDKGGLQNLIGDAQNFLLQNKIISSDKIGSITLSGHSGAYRAMAFSLMRGGLTDKIKNVILFDALYGQMEKFSHWISNYGGKFFNIYTSNGGTKDDSEALMEDLDGWGISYYSNEELKMTDADLRDNRLIFIYSDLEHNGVVFQRNQFARFLKFCIFN